MTKTEMRELNRLTNAITQTMVSIAYTNYYRQKDNEPETVDDDVDTAFTAIEYSFPMFSCITDTVTRRCAKTEIYEALRSATTWCAFDKKIDPLNHIKSSITAESVMDDIINMNGEDDEDSVDFDTLIANDPEKYLESIK
jgi:hypothetical protein